MKIQNLIHLQFGDQPLVGEFIERTEVYISVKIGYPFKGWISEARMTNGSPKGYFNYLSEYGDAEGEVLLINIYNKLLYINRNINYFVHMYTGFKEMIEELEKIKNSVRRKRIIAKLKQWFFISHLLKPEKTGFYLTPIEVKQLEEILETYLTTGVKLYFKNEIDIEDLD